MDFTWMIDMELLDIEALKPANDVAEYSKRLMVEHCKNFSPDGKFKFHDPSVVISMQYNEHFESKKIQICLDENNENFGRLSINNSGYEVYIFRPAMNVNELFVNNILEILGLSK